LNVLFDIVGHRSAKIGAGLCVLGSTKKYTEQRDIPSHKGIKIRAVRAQYR